MGLINLESQNFRFIDFIDEEIEVYKNDVTEVSTDSKIIRIFEVFGKSTVYQIIIFERVFTISYVMDVYGQCKNNAIGKQQIL